MKVYNPEKGKHFKTVDFYKGLIFAVFNYDVNTRNYEKTTYYCKESISSEFFLQSSNRETNKIHIL
ncbi:hypothetical protein CPX_001230 [Candidatus Phytoplasma pruni]|uniref:Uncharacterized protein n=1 Tax=Candidatus Phytoplasma pruni TaxID=479893 RepID=A0A0M1N117_9MOLU|nr:hypothetical protein CPX_001230 [Candidatus Phytoplasma pruni]